MARTISAFATAFAIPGLAVASGAANRHDGGTACLANGQFTYEVFEAIVEHADMEGCPTETDTDAVFCRVTIASDLTHIFVFSHNGDQSLQEVKSY